VTRILRDEMFGQHVHVVKGQVKEIWDYAYNNANPDEINEIELTSVYVIFGNTVVKNAHASNPIENICQALYKLAKNNAFDVQAFIAETSLKRQFEMMLRAFKQHSSKELKEELENRGVPSWITGRDDRIEVSSKRKIQLDPYGDRTY